MRPKKYIQNTTVQLLHKHSIVKCSFFLKGKYAKDLAMNSLSSETAHLHKVKAIDF